MKRNILLSYFLFLVFSNLVFGSSELKVIIGNKTTSVKSVEVHGTNYISTKELATALSANYFYNSKRQKSEIKFINYKLKFTVGNQFVILTSRKDNQHQIFQIPLSARINNDDVYIPIQYIVKYLSYASGSKLNYNKATNTITIDKEKVDAKKIVTWNKELYDRSKVKFDIFSAKVETKYNGTLVRLRTKNEIRKPSSSIKGNVLYLFFSDVTIDKNEIKKAKTSGLVKNIKSKYVKGNLQVEIKLRSGVKSHEVFYDPDIGEILISIHSKFLKQNPTEEVTSKWNFEVVVLDAGHGGRDPGAIGLNKVREKDINLSIVKKLGKLIEKKLPNVKVVYTRENDKFVELHRRGAIANESHGNLFISVHCNSLPKKPSKTRGFEVYLLRPGRTKEAIDIAEFENSVISMEKDPSRYKKLNDENFILVSMAHAANMRYSESFAEMLNTEWIKKVSIPSRGIKQAGFYVLVGASMPSVLLEVGFLTNKEDVALLKSNSGQQKIAQSIFDGIFKYKKYYENSINNELEN
ncbi:MAG: N-acetylmuramoyl-L-alanine amidase [Melioribacteraceae bacterium]